MAWFKEPDFKERQKAAMKAQQAALKKFHAKAVDPAAVEAAAIAGAKHRANRNARSKKRGAIAAKALD